MGTFERSNIAPSRASAGNFEVIAAASRQPASELRANPIEKLIGGGHAVLPGPMAHRNTSLRPRIVRAVEGAI